MKMSADPATIGVAYSVLIWLGNKTEALAGLEALREHGLTDAVDPMWDAVRASPEFLQVIEKMGIAENYRKAWKQIQAYEKHPRKP